MKKTLLLFLFTLLNTAQAQNFLWAKNIGSYLYAAATNTSGDIYTTGNFSGVVDFDPGVGTYTVGISGSSNHDLYISKSNASGNFLFAVGVVVTIGQGYVIPSAIKTDMSGNVYVTGKYLTAVGAFIDFDPGPGSYTVSSAQITGFILKLDGSGNFIWMKSIEGTSGNSLGNSIAIDASGDIFISGHFVGTTDFDPGIPTYTLSAPGGFYQSYLLKLNASGNFVWVKSISGTSDVLVTSIALDASANIYCTGHYFGTGDFDPGLTTYTLASAGSDDIFMLKLDATGNFIWAKSMGGIGSNYANCLAVDALGNSHLTGASAGTADFDPGVGIYNLTSAGPTDIFVLRLDALGNLGWVKTIGTSSASQWLKNAGLSIDLDNWGNVYTVGAFSGSLAVDFDPGAGTYFMNAAPTASWSSFITELDAVGNFIWAGTMQGGEARSVIVNGSNVYVAGIFVASNDLDPTVGTYSPVGFSDGFIVKLTTAPSIGGPVLLCNNNGSATATYSVLPEPGNTYTWTVSPGAVLNSSANAFSVNVTLLPGATTIAVTVNNASVSIVRSVTVTLATPPVVSITAIPSLSVCTGSSLTLIGTGASTNVWSGGISNNVPFQPALSGNYIFTGIAASGCAASITASVNVYPPPIIFYSVAPAYTVCSGYTVSFTQMGAGVSTYTFSGGILNNVPYTITTSTVVTITGTGPSGCTSSFSLPIGASPLPTLVITASPSPTVCAGTAITLGATGASSTYSWNGGVINNSPFVPVANAVYTVAATGTNNCLSRATVSIVVNPLPTVGATIVPSGVICAGSTYTLNAAGALSYTWASGVSNAFPFTAVSNTAYVVSGTNAQGCINTATIPVVVNALPNVGAVVLPSSTVCIGSIITISGTGASTYTWNGGILNNVQFAATTSTSYVVNGLSATGCANTASIHITVHPLPVVGALVLPSPTVCTGSTLNLSGTGAVSYSWSGGILNNTSFTALSNNVYTVTGIDGNGCTNTLSISTSVNPLPSIGFVALPSASVCIGSSVYLSGTGASSYTWSNGVNNNSWFLPSATTVYSLSGTGSNGCTSHLTATVTVNPQPGIVVQPLSQTLAIGSTTQFIVASTNISTVFQWQQNQGAGFINLVNAGQFLGVNTATLTVINVSSSQNGNTFRCVLTEGSCSDTSDVALLSVYDATGIAEWKTENDFNLSPNPAKDFCVIFINQLTIGLNYYITDQTGRLVLMSSIDNSKTVIDVHALAPGLYFVSILNAGQKPKKLLKY